MKVFIFSQMPLKQINRAYPMNQMKREKQSMGFISENNLIFDMSIFKSKKKTKHLIEKLNN